MDPDTELINTKSFGKITGHTKIVGLCHSSLDELELSMQSSQQLTLIATNEIIQYRDLMMKFESLRETEPNYLTRDQGKAKKVEIDRGQ